MLPWINRSILKNRSVIRNYPKTVKVKNDILTRKHCFIKLTSYFSGTRSRRSSSLPRKACTPDSSSTVDARWAFWICKVLLTHYLQYRQCYGSVAFWCGFGRFGCRSGSEDPVALTNWSDPDPTSDPTPFFSDFKNEDAKKNYFFRSFLIFLKLKRRYIIFRLKNLIVC